MRVLVVEDNEKTASYLAKGLKENGFLADVAFDGEEGFFMATQNPYDLIILDVMLPKLSGWELLSNLREKGSSIPVLFLTAKDGVEDRVKGLNLGGDDYLVKPFSFSELLARIRSVLRRNQDQAKPIIQVADLEIDLLKHQARRGEQKLTLSSKEFILLSFMASRVGEVLSRTYIAEKVWDINFDSDTNVIDVAIKRLREKINLQKGSTQLIHTVRGVGYVLEER